MVRKMLLEVYSDFYDVLSMIPSVARRVSNMVHQRQTNVLKHGGLIFVKIAVTGGLMLLKI